MLRKITEFKSPQEAKEKNSSKFRIRRLIWLVSMICFFVWFGISMIVQQFKISDREEVLRTRQAHLNKVQNANRELVEDHNKFSSEDYLLELAHKFGYGKKGDQNFKLK